MWATAHFAVAAAALSAAWASPAFAADAPFGVRLAYADRSGANCPNESSLRAAAVARLGYDPFVHAARATVSVTITRGGRGLKGEIRVEESSGDCAELGKAMALAISIAADAMRASNEPAPPHEREAPMAPPTSQPPVSQDEHLVPPAIEPELVGDGSIESDLKGGGAPKAALPGDAEHWQVSLHGLTSVGFAPGVTFGGVVGAGWVGTTSSFEVEGRADYPQSTAHGVGTISVWPLLFTVAPCVNVRGWAFCGLGRVGALHGTGHGFPRNLSGSSVLATAGARLANEAILSKPLRFRVFFDLDWIATNNSFDVDHRSAWATSGWAVSLGLGLTTRLF